MISLEARIREAKYVEYVDRGKGRRPLILMCTRDVRDAATETFRDALIALGPVPVISKAPSSVTPEVSQT